MTATFGVIMTHTDSHVNLLRWEKQAAELVLLCEGALAKIVKEMEG